MGNQKRKSPKEIPVGETKVGRELREIVVLLGWCYLASLFKDLAYSETLLEITGAITSFIRIHGTKQDLELLKRIPKLIENDIAKMKSRKKQGVSIDVEGGESTKKWVAQLLKGIAEDMGK